MATDFRSFHPPAPIVAITGWLLPGSGYALIGQWGRAITIGITIIVLFVMGLLIGGVRVIEVPGFNVDTGEKQMTTLMTDYVDPVRHTTESRVLIEPLVDPVTHKPILDSNGEPKTGPARRWVLDVSVLGEIRDKPWSVPQILTGPIAIIAGWGSVQAAHVDPATVKLSQEHGNDPKLIRAYGEITHARINEIGSLYLSVAGLLNLMAIIDSAWRASQINEKRKETAE
jgi:hypothetical protein